VPSCRSAKRPVVLLHGSFSTTASNFSALSRALRTSGRCVYALDYGNGGVLSIRSSADQFTAFVATVRTLSGSTEVDVIGYSQGGLVLRTALHFNGLVGQVNTAVLLAPSWHGTTARLAGSIPAALCPACADQAAGSPLLRALDAGGELAAGVHYAEISTRADVVVTPINSQIPIGPASRVRSAVVEDLCPGLVTDHIQLPATRAAISWTISALDTNGRPASNGLTC
jgi:triacylglycerol lipase